MTTTDATSTTDDGVTGSPDPAELPDTRERESIRDVSQDSVGSPTAFPGAAIAGGLLGIVLLVCCGLLIRDLLAAAGAIDGDTWVHRAAVNLGSQTWSNWMWVVPVGCALVGIVALWLAIKPRHRTHVNLADHPVVWTRRVDVARRVSAAVSDLPDVRSAVTVISRRRVKVMVTATGAVDTERVAATAREAVASARVGRKTVVKVKRGVRS